MARHAGRSLFNVNTPEHLAEAERLAALHPRLLDPTAINSEPVLLDLRGLRCPLPALRTRKALSRTPPGGRLRVACTDPLSVIDIPHLVAATGDVLESQSEEAGVHVFSLRRSG